VKLETKKRILELLRDEMRAVGFPAPEDVLEKSSANTDRPPLTAEETNRQVALLFWHQFEELLDSLPEPGSNDIEELLARHRERDLISGIRY
jgi:hypothetical protein